MKPLDKTKKRKTKKKSLRKSSDESIKKIYKGAKKLLNKDSAEYNEIVEKNREAWKKLADL